MSILIPKTSDDSVDEICNECFKLGTDIGVHGITDGKIHHAYYCEECWNKIKHRPFKERYNDEQEERRDSDEGVPEDK
jgi:hypothetical protein